MVTERDEAYVRDCADRINYEMTGLRTGNAGMRVSDAALLCAMNFLDELGRCSWTATSSNGSSRSALRNPPGSGGSWMNWKKLWQN